MKLRIHTWTLIKVNYTEIFIYFANSLTKIKLHKYVHTFQIDTTRTRHIFLAL